MDDGYIPVFKSPRYALPRGAILGLVSGVSGPVLRSELFMSSTLLCWLRNRKQVAIEEGVLFGAGKILQYQKTIAKDDARTYFLPNAEAMGLLSDVVSMVNSKAVELGAVGTAYVGMQEYMEALAWPKDSDTGLR